MAGALSFHVTVYQTNAKVLPELANKAKDLTPLFETIISEWAKGNAEKFALGSGASASPLEIDPTVTWQPLTEKYFREKTRHFPPDLMVRTGALKASLMNPDGFFRAVNPEQAIFGTPNDPDDMIKVVGNWKKRQTIFLSDSDQNMIRQKTAKYFTVQMQSATQSAAQMDADFAGTVG